VNATKLRLHVSVSRLAEVSLAVPADLVVAMVKGSDAVLLATCAALLR
jgi:hypothetical protein